MKMPRWFKTEDWFAIAAISLLFLFFAKFSTDSGNLREGAIIIASDPMWWVMIAMGFMYRIMRKTWGLS